MLGSSFIQRFRRRFEATVADAETRFNVFSESDGYWWPFGFLRPNADDRFSTRRAAMLSVLQGVPVAALLVAVDGSARHAAIHRGLLGFLSLVCVAAFIANRFIVAYFWNRRAARLGVRRE